MSDSQSQTKPSTSQHTLDSFITSSKPSLTPKPIATSTEIRDRGSTFVANIFTASSSEEAKSHTKYVKHVLHGNRKATHEIAAWRCMVVKPGCTGLGGPEEFQVESGSMDDGERYGGTLLGPSRFDHIETCTAEVCRAFKRSEELRESITTLETLDTLLEGLREELKTFQQAVRKFNSPTTLDGDSESQSAFHKKAPEERIPGHDIRVQTEKKKPDYSSIDLAKARRLIKARENSIKWVKDSLNDLRSSSSKGAQE